MCSTCTSSARAARRAAAAAVNHRVLGLLGGHVRFTAAARRAWKMPSRLRLYTTNYMQFEIAWNGFRGTRTLLLSRHAGTVMHHGTGMSTRHIPLAGSIASAPQSPWWLPGCAGGGGAPHTPPPPPDLPTPPLLQPAGLPGPFSGFRTRAGTSEREVRIKIQTPSQPWQGLEF